MTPSDFLVRGAPVGVAHVRPALTVFEHIKKPTENGLRWPTRLFGTLDAVGRASLPQRNENKQDPTLRTPKTMYAAQKPASTDFAISRTQSHEPTKVFPRHKNAQGAIGAPSCSRRVTMPNKAASSALLDSVHGACTSSLDQRAGFPSNPIHPPYVHYFLVALSNSSNFIRVV
jgi:hypothetical protein